MTRGWGVWAIVWTMPARVPGPRPAIPCQNPRPGQACRTAIPARNTPNPASTARPSRGVRQLRSGSATRAPANAAEHDQNVIVRHAGGTCEPVGPAYYYDLSYRTPTGWACHFSCTATGLSGELVTGFFDRVAQGGVAGQGPGR